MKVSMTIVDSRPDRSSSYAGLKIENYDRVSITDAEMSTQVAAGILRAIADDLDGLEFVREVSA